MFVQHCVLDAGVCVVGLAVTGWLCNMASSDFDQQVGASLWSGDGALGFRCWFLVLI